MPDHRGQTYDPNEGPAIRGGWFGMVERPYPARLDRAFRMLAIVLAIVAAATAGWLLSDLGTKTAADATAWGAAGALVLIASAMAYGFTRAVGMIAVGIYSTARDGSEFVVDWQALRHDLPLRRTRVLLLEAALLVATVGAGLWGLNLFYRHGEAYGLAMFVLVCALLIWPAARRWIQGQAGR